MSAARTLLVVDASVGIKLFIEEEGADAAHEVFNASTRDPEHVSIAVPDLFFVECASVLWKTVRRGLRAPEQARRDIASLATFGLAVVPGSALCSRALDIGLACGISAYDACYVAAAAQSGVALVTADARLARAVTPDIARVVLLQDVAASLRP